MAAKAGYLYRPLDRIDHDVPHNFILPVKKINDGQDVSTFLVSKAYRDIMHFLFQLNKAMVPRLVQDVDSGQTATQTYEIGSSAVQSSETILRLRTLLSTLSDMIDEVPLDRGPRRFGNLSFRKWYGLVESRSTVLLEQHLPFEVSTFKHESDLDALTELRGYFLGSFGSSQRLDYGTGHELSFLAFLGCLWKLGGFPDQEAGQQERGIVLGVIEPYLSLIRRLILTYTLEPAGSHGVWGLDDHSFLPYIFGSAQYSTPITDADQVPTEGSLPEAPDPGIVTKAPLVEKQRETNLYFGAIGFIYDVKKGPFWEHSPTLYDISGVQAGWSKINKGMLKMYNAEVLSKFPVVQHFPFGSLFRWEPDSDAVEPPPSIHTSSHPNGNSANSVSVNSAAMRYPLQEGTLAPWAVQTQNYSKTGGRGLSLSTSRFHRPAIRNSVSLAVDSSVNDGDTGSKPLPWSGSAETRSGLESMPPPTKAPWAK